MTRLPKLSENKTLASQWHFTKNLELSPKDISQGSNKKVWWICDRGHEWEARVYKRTIGQGCQICKSLAYTHTEIAREWHPTKNKALTPFGVKHGSSKKVWWICDKGHEWEVAISERTRSDRRSRCRICAGMRATPNNNLAILYPDLAKEWHPTKNAKLTPNDVRPGSNKKVTWICKYGHEWQAVIGSRVSGCGCPYCQGRRVNEDNNLAVLYPDLAKEWHPTKNAKLTPNDVRPGSNKKVTWICKYGHEWQAVIGSRALGGRGCPFCTRQTSSPEIQIYCELKNIFNEVNWREKINKIECDVYLPKYKIVIEYDGYYWHRNKERKDKLKIKKLNKMGVFVIRIRERPLDIIYKNDISHNPNNEILGTIKIVLNKISHLTEKNDALKIKNYIKGNRYNNIKEFKQILSELPAPPPEKSLLNLYPNLVKEWDYEENLPLRPEMFSPGSNKKLSWKCKYGHRWKAIITNRVRGVGCPFCTNRFAGDDNNLALLYPEIAKQWHPTKNGDLTPYDVTPGSERNIVWQCYKGHEWKTVVLSRTQGRGCPYCSNKKADKDNNLAVLFPDTIDEWHPTKNGDLTPYDVTPGSGKIVYWLCSKGHEYQKRIVAIKNGAKCSYCTNRHAGDDNNLAVLNPEIARHWHPTKNGKLLPTDVVPGSSKKVMWLCENNHEYEQRVFHRVRGQGCKKCH